MTSRVHIFSITLIVMALIVLASGELASSLLAQERDQEDTQTKIETLLTERRDVLLERFNAVETNYRSGATSFDSVVSARSDLLEAELALADSATKRAAILEQQLDNYRQFEEVVAKRVAAGQAGFDEMLLAKSERMRVEIDWLREKITTK